MNLLGVLAKVDPYQNPGPDENASSTVSTPPPVARQLSYGELSSGPAASLPSVAEVVAGLSKSATKKRVARLMQRKQDGTFKVPEELVKEWHAGNQDTLTEEFITAGMDKEASLKIIFGFNTF